MYMHGDFEILAQIHLGESSAGTELDLELRDR